ncbi:energy transducer TonB [Uliginosibacterium sp. sgz301328]|uniref:energy transducer TonB n=1 Tax=Uliginosibacterium sp. sgz301328 TaxID=3243764 RepID=UPI00359E3576
MRLIALLPFIFLAACGSTSTKAPPTPQAAHLLSTPKPEYPTTAMQGGQQGRVVVKAWLTPDGEVQRTAVDRSSGWPALDVAALEGVKDWKIRPARTADGKMVDTILLPVDFRLKD